MLCTVTELDYVEGTHSKFYRLYDLGRTSVFQWGRRGQIGQSKSSRHMSAREGQEACWMQQRVKEDRGYGHATTLRFAYPKTLDECYNIEALHDAFQAASVRDWALRLRVLADACTGAAERIVLLRNWDAERAVAVWGEAMAAHIDVFPHHRLHGADVYLWGLPRKAATWVMDECGAHVDVTVVEELRKGDDALVFETAFGLAGDAGRCHPVDAAALLTTITALSDARLILGR